MVSNHNKKVNYASIFLKIIFIKLKYNLKQYIFLIKSVY